MGLSARAALALGVEEPKTFLPEGASATQAPQGAAVPPEVVYRRAAVRPPEAVEPQVVVR